ncbi:MAG: Hsp20/alpha crystallin family protein [Syntrophobacterales bacterium]|nr:MAG: Hsp20/alpha crystallin family protein [Syntrophobacterales bacterium]
MAEKELTPWRPFTELSNLRREMDRLWEGFFGERPFARVWEREWAPSLDMSETKDNFVVKAEVPGIDAKDIDISLTGDILTIRGMKKQEKDEKEEDYHLVERSYGSFSRSVRLPTEVESNKIKASYKNGILNITLPKSERVKAKEVKIKVE